MSGPRQRAAAAGTNGAGAPPGETLIRFEGVDIVFGDDPGSALPLIDEGLSRDAIRERTAQVVGVAGADLHVRRGEIVVLMGLSGSGKSTLLRAVNGLAPVARGRCTVRVGAGDGEGGGDAPSDRGGDTLVDPAACPPRALRNLRKHTVSMVFQQFALLPWRSVADNVGFGLELAGVKPAERRERAVAQLARVGLAERADARVSELSGGMQQRVGLARALATEAPILLMDEPFSALDPIVRARLQDDLLVLQRDLQRTIVFVSHDLDEAFKLGDRIAIMEGGRIVQVGTPLEIARAPASAYVADFVGHMNPLGVLTAMDVMRPFEGAAGGAMRRTLAGSAAPQTPIDAVIAALEAREGAVAVIDRGVIVGTIEPRDVVRALARACSVSVKPRDGAGSFAD